ncbi:MAG TPA: IucA/IucC family protein, partial [Myxococcaceae bacterium]|nr:IucA/IucC family protein [Myxococcaceae bacterium]
MGADVKAARGYLFQRVLDTLLREDVGGCVSRGRLSSVAPSSLTRAGGGTSPGQWLVVERGGEVDRVWLPVRPSAHMQDWCFDAGRQVVAERDGALLFPEPEELVRWLLPPGTPDEEECLKAFGHEFRTALEHRLCCEAERQRLFAGAATGGTPGGEWWERLLHHDRLASFQDHPYYPTARAKVGFGLADLERYAPEFQPIFALRWLALPKALLPVQGEERPA